MATDPTKLQDLATNNIPGVDNIPSTDPESASALDAAFAAKGGDPNKPEEPLADLGQPKAKDKPAPPEKPAAPIKADEDEDETPKSKDLPDAGDSLDALERKAREPKEKPAAPKADETPAPKKDEKPATPAEKDEFDAVELPINVKPNTVKSFDRVKEVARERIAAVTKEKEALAKQLEETKAKVVEGLPKEVEAELKTLREFRAKVDVEADPAFSTYDKTIADNTEAIYARLLATPGIDQKAVDAIKALGGPGEVDWDAPNIKLPAQVRRFLDAKLVENETVAEKKVKAIADAKSNAEQYISIRRQEQTEGAKLQNTAVEKEIETLLPKFPWFKELKAKDGATDAEKKSVDDHNKLIEESRATLKMAVEDNSPQMRSILAVGYAQLLKTRADFDVFRAESKAKDTAHAEEKAALTKELEDTKAKLEKIKRSSTTRLRDTPADDANAPSGGKAKNIDLNTPGSEALDRQLAEIRAKQD